MPTATFSSATLADIEFHADSLDLAKAGAAYLEHGCLVVRGLFHKYVGQIHADIEAAAQQAISLLPQARQVPEGWVTPEGTLWLPAPEGFARKQQIMVLGVNYRSSAAFFHSAMDPVMLDLAVAGLGPDVELFMDGQCLYKEPVGGHPKHLHQDAAYFEHKYEGPLAVLTYCVPTDDVNGCLHVVPGSHKLGLLRHVDTFSHLGLDSREWPWERSLPIHGGPGDAIFFHVKTIHGSKENFSKSSRPVFIHRYRRADDYVVVSGTTTDNRSRAEKQAAEAKKQNQLGLMVRGSRRYDGGR